MINSPKDARVFFVLFKNREDKSHRVSDAGGAGTDRPRGLQAGPRAPPTLLRASPVRPGERVREESSSPAALTLP